MMHKDNDSQSNPFESNDDSFYEDLVKLHVAQPQNEDDIDNTLSDEDEVETRVSRNHFNYRPIRKVFKIILNTIFLLFVLGVIIGVGIFAYYAKDAPNVTTTQLVNAGSSRLYTKDGKLLLTLGQAKRDYITYDEIPQQMKDAVISVEDKRFYKEDFGIDPIRIVSSTLRNLKDHNITAGGSTITQQLIKLSAFSTKNSDRTLKRKVQEAWIAIHISHQYPKSKILEYYINKVYMNHEIYGLGTAAQYYYGKELNQLDLAQTALLAGMPNAPTTYDPYIYPANATYRRNIVLLSMFNNHKITKQQYKRACSENVQNGLLQEHDSESHLFKVDDPYIKEVVNEIEARGYDPYHDNLKITVNIDQTAQNKLYELANDGKVPFTNKKMQVGATVIDPNNGHVVAIIGGRHLPDVQLGLDRAVQTGRSTGSSIKPILDYAPAIQYKHWSTAQILADTPYVYKGTKVQLYDWDNQYYGDMTMRYALEQSRNVPAVRTLEDVGLTRAAKFAKRMGISVDPKQGISVAIGANASTLQMAGAYSALADNGIYHSPKFVSKIETVNGDIENFDDSGKRVMDDSTAYMITDMLKGVITRGSGTKAKISDLAQAGKTGTVKYSDNELKMHPSYKSTPKDSWFVGYTRSYAMAVWTGYDNLSDGKIDSKGENSATLLYKNMMSYLMKDKANLDWVRPKSVVVRSFNGQNELYQKIHAPAKPKKKKVLTHSTSRIPRYYRSYSQSSNNYSGSRSVITSGQTPQTSQKQVVRNNNSARKQTPTTSSNSHSTNQNNSQTRQQTLTPQNQQPNSNAQAETDDNKQQEVVGETGTQ